MTEAVVVVGALVVVGAVVVTGGTPPLPESCVGGSWDPETEGPDLPTVSTGKMLPGGIILS